MQVFYESLNIVLVAFTTLLAAALLALVSKKLERDRHLARFTEDLQRFEPFVDAWLLHADPRLFNLPARDVLRAREVIEQLLLQAAAGYDELWARSHEAFGKLGFDAEHIRELGSRDPQARAGAAYMLGRFEWAPAERRLVGLLSDRERDVRLAALRALARIGSPQALRNLLMLLREDRTMAPERVAELFAEITPEVEAVATKMLLDGDEDARVFGALVLGRSSSASARAVLEKAALCDSSIEVRAKAVTGVARVGRRKSAAVIKACLSDESWVVRAQAAKSAGTVQAVSLCSDLATAMTDREWWVRHNAAASLRVMGDRGRNTLEVLLSSDDRFARETAAEALQLSGACDRYIDDYLAAVRGRPTPGSRPAEEILDLIGRLAATGATSRIIDRLESESSIGAAVRLRRLLEPRVADDVPNPAGG